MIFARKLARKVVMSLDGTVIGTVHNISVELKTGSLINVVVKPEDKYLKLDMHGGYYIIPFKDIKSIRDYVVVDRTKIKSEAI
ncbi:MAG: PRC-barrel domain-containing protein [Archaeoglobaceae archaeon]